MEYFVIAPSLVRVGEVFPLLVNDVNGFEKIVSISVDGKILYSVDAYASDAVKSEALAYSFSTAGDKVLSVDIQEEGRTVSLEVNVKVVEEAQDRVLTSDQELLNIDTKAMRHLPAGRLSWLYKIRHATNDILLDLQEHRWKGAVEKDFNKITDEFAVDVDDIYSISDVRAWANYYVLYLIYNDLWDSSDDVNFRKASEYFSKAEIYKEKSIVRVKKDGGACKPQSKRTARLSRGL